MPAADPLWFTERSPLWPGRTLSLAVRRLLFRQRSEFQLIEVFETETCGRMLALDGVIQLTESDEFAYQEMITHVPMFAHPRPARVLIVGGGDGGVAREVARHSQVERIDVCELDPMVVDVCRRFIPSTGKGFDDPRVQVHYEDGAAFVAQAASQYDVVIVDSTDPLGPGETLFGEPFHTSLRHALAAGGLLAAQGESIYLHPEVVTGLGRVFDGLYDQWGYAYTLVPTYPGGSIGICVGSAGPKISPPMRQPDQAFQARLSYYTPAVHQAAFVLPSFGERLIKAASQEPSA
jgi:spermidine synthase